MRISRTETTLNYVLLSLFAVGALVPLLGVLLSAVTPEGELRIGFDLPSRISLGNFAAAWQQGGFSRYMLNSVLVALGVVLLTAVLATLATSRTADLLGDAPRLEALTEGFDRAFKYGAGFAATGALAALLLVPRRLPHAAATAEA